MAKKTNKAYLKQSHLVSIVLAVIPITNLLLGILYRLQKNNILLALLNILLSPLFYIVYLISFLLNNVLKYLV